MSTGREIRLVESDGYWTAIDEETGDRERGESPEAALSALTSENEQETISAGDETDLGDALADLAVDVETDAVSAVREIREDA